MLTVVLLCSLIIVRRKENPNHARGTAQERRCAHLVEDPLENQTADVDREARGSVVQGLVVRVKLSGAKGRVNHSW